MIKSKFKKALIAGICFSVLSTGVAFASEGGSQPATLPADTQKIEVRQPVTSVEVPLVSPDAPVSSQMPEQKEIDSEICEKQSKIDKYVFEDHASEIKEKGFTVTHTGPYADYVEIGITPYSEENAKYLYDTFGKDQVKVVEGQQAQLYSTSSASDGKDAEVTIVSEAEQASESSSFNSPILYVIGAFVLVVGSFITRGKLSKK